MKKLGNIKDVDYNLNTPDIKFKAKDMNQLSIFVGANGTGKTLHMIFVWCFNLLLDARYRYKWKTEEAFKQTCNNIFKHSFVDLELDGSVLATYSCGTTFNIVFSKGKVTEVSISKPDSVIVNCQAIFMSKQTRTYSEINKYYKVKNAVYGTNDPIKFSQFYDPSPNLKGLLNINRVYDILFLEKLVEVFNKPQKVDEDVIKMLDNASTKDLDTIKFDTITNGLVGYKKNGDIINLETLSAGEQSLLNIAMTSKTMN